MRRALIGLAFAGLCALPPLAQVLNDKVIEATDLDEPVPPLGAALPVSAEPMLPRLDPAALLSVDVEARREQAVPAKVIFGGVHTPAPLAASAIGSYSRGCLAGAEPVPIDGETWQVMRVSRNRNWGHPELVALVERLAEDAAAKDGWQGLLVGDLSQPRGGPMLSDHASHQIGLDVDIWLTPMPARRLSQSERDKMPFTSMLGKDGVHVDPEVFTPYHAALIRRAASYPQVERIFIHPAIKKAMCEQQDVDRTHYYKIRPARGHDEHMHIRIVCPKGSPECRRQPDVGHEDGCGAELDGWLRRLRPQAAAEPAPEAAARPAPVKRLVTLADLPATCREVVTAGTLEAGAKTAPERKATRAANSGR